MKGLHHIADDLDLANYWAWVDAGLEELGAYLGRWAEFGRHHGS